MVARQALQLAFACGTLPPGLLLLWLGTPSLLQRLSLILILFPGLSKKPCWGMTSACPEESLA